MSVRRMGAAWLLVTVVVAGYVVDADAQVPPPPGFVDGDNVVLTAQAAAPAQPAVPAQVVPPTPLPAPAPGSRPSVPARTSRLTGFSAVLVTGDTEDATSGRGATPQLEVPAAARKALASISSFLPYKSYSMADAALVSAAVNGSYSVFMRDTEQAATLLRLNLLTSPPSGDTYNVTVHLTEVPASRLSEDKTGRQMISANVNITPGETVVVGTSRLGGGRKAYVLLLTAIGK